MKHDMNRAWLPWLGEDVPPECDTCERVAAFELNTGCAALGARKPILRAEGPGEGYTLSEEGGQTVISGGSTGLLYGAYAYLEALAAGEAPPRGQQQPRYALRMLDCWDNPDGSVERGYSGRSLFFEGGSLAWDARRMRQLGRMLASAGINVLCVNNVNVTARARRLIEDDGLAELSRLADVFRICKEGVRVGVQEVFMDCPHREKGQYIL